MSPKPPVNLEQDPLKSPFKSRRFWVTIATLLLDAVIAWYPPLANVQEQLITVISWLGMALVGGLTLTHAVNRVEPLWKSRRFWTAIATGVLTIGVALYPPLAAIQADLIDLITGLGMTLIAGLTVTDIALLRGWTSKH